ncbi:MAG: endo alpha-1,4 polygalactosaminidase [Parcubacteria group bacterium]|nr:endo alpha-1,4 polygalactosaminidase [Parcubacteria group bacterium]
MNKKLIIIALTVLIIIAAAIFIIGRNKTNNSDSNTTYNNQPDDAVRNSVWTPPPGTTWQWQLDGDFNNTVDAEVYDLDLFDSSKELVDSLHQQDKKMICYVSVGSYEDWRPDAQDFPSSVIGKKYAGWTGEKWLDISQIDLLGPIMKKRLDLCAEKGFDAVEPDNIDGYDNKTGFNLSYDDQLKYNIWLANEAHQRGLSIGLKNNADQAQDLEPYYDWAMTEDCAVQEWCQDMEVFIQNDKAVFQAEYTDEDVDFDQVCKNAKSSKFSPILKNRDLDAEIKTCSQ